MDVVFADNLTTSSVRDTCMDVVFADNLTTTDLTWQD